MVLKAILIARVIKLKAALLDIYSKDWNNSKVG